MSAREGVAVPSAAAGLEDGLSRLSPDWVEVRNLLVTRQVLLGPVLGLSHPGLRLVPAGPEDDVRHWVLLEGSQGRLAQLGVSSVLVQRMGVAQGLRPAMASALAASLMAPLLPALRAFFGQTISVRVVDGQDAGDTAHWPHFRIFYPEYRFSDPCRLHPAFIPALRARASACPRQEVAEVDLPLAVGLQLRLRPAELQGLRAGDALVDDGGDPATACVFFESGRTAAQVAPLAIVDVASGVVRHLVPPRPPGLPLQARRAACVRVDIVLAQLNAPSRSLYRLAVGQQMPGWTGLAWLPEPELRLAGRCVARLKRATVAAMAGFEVAGSLPR